MIETGIFFLFYLGDWLLAFTGPGGYLLLVFPLFLYWRNYSTEKILAASALSGLLAEMMHGLLAGSLVLGLGVAIFIFQALRSVIKWNWPAVRVLGLVVFLFLVFSVRLFLIYAFYQSFVWPGWLALLVTILVGSVFVGIGYMPRPISLLGRDR